LNRPFKEKLDVSGVEVKVRDFAVRVTFTLTGHLRNPCRHSCEGSVLVQLL
jgi:hypothetical protein